jgi:dihydroorotase
LARMTGARVHFLHLSTARSAALVAAAKAEGVAVTAEVTPHHLTFTDAELASFDGRYKVNPPLRSDSDVAALRRACAAGTLDAVATDHAPHTSEVKDAPLADAPPGMLGLETALAATMEALGTTGAGMTEAAVLALLCWGPAVVARLDQGAGGEHGGPLVAGAAANICVFDPGEEWVLDARLLASRSSNTPWEGRRLRGRVRHTVFRGEPVVVGGEAQR